MENPLPAVHINSLEVHQGSPLPGPAFSLQREYLCSYRGGGPLRGSWSGLPWLSYTSRGREPKIRLQKVAWFTKQKKLGLCGLVSAPILAKMGRLYSKFRERCHPLHLSTCTEFGVDWLRLARLILERLIFWPKSRYNIGFQPTIKLTTGVRVSMLVYVGRLALNVTN